MYFDVYRDRNVHGQQYWWVAKGENHEPMAHSEMLSTKADCVNSIRTIIQEASSARIFDDTGENPAGNPQERRLD